MMHYELCGQNDRVILFIHGFGGFSGLWRWQVEHFSKRFLTLSVDLPGHGHTPWAPCGLPQMAQEIVSILDQNKISRVSVVASSFGGLVALALWSLAPSRIASMTLSGSLPRFVAAPDFPAGLTVAGIRKLAQQFDGDVGKVLDMFVRSFSTPQERLSPQYARVKELRKEAILPEREALLAFLDILQTADLREVLSNVNVPLQFITGSGDYICPPPAMLAVARLVPRARMDSFEDYGHGLFLTMPQVFNQTLEDFLGYDLVN